MLYLTVSPLRVIVGERTPWHGVQGPHAPYDYAPLECGHLIAVPRSSTAGITRCGECLDVAIARACSACGVDAGVPCCTPYGAPALALCAARLAPVPTA